MGYVGWALLGMVGYSLVTLLVKLATRSGEASSFFVLAVAVLIVGSVAWAIAILRGDFTGFTVSDLAKPSDDQRSNRHALQFNVHRPHDGYAHQHGHGHK